MKIERGKYNVKLKKEGYETSEHIVVLSDQKPQETIEITLTQSGIVFPGFGEVNKVWFTVIPFLLGILGFLLRLMRG
jgi:hypothetical protein